MRPAWCAARMSATVVANCSAVRILRDDAPRDIDLLELGARVPGRHFTGRVHRPELRAEPPCSAGRSRSVPGLAQVVGCDVAGRFLSVRMPRADRCGRRPGSRRAAARGRASAPRRPSVGLGDAAPAKVENAINAHRVHETSAMDVTSIVLRLMRSADSARAQANLISVASAVRSPAPSVSLVPRTRLHAVATGALRFVQRRVGAL